MKLNITIVASIIGCIIGVFIGIAVYSTFFCVDTNQAIVEQLKKDNKALTEIKKEVEVKYVYREKIKTVIKNTPALIVTGKHI